jgi:hypothetical protein
LASFLVSDFLFKVYVFSRAVFSLTQDYLKLVEILFNHFDPTNAVKGAVQQNSSIPYDKNDKIFEKYAKIVV